MDGVAYRWRIPPEVSDEQVVHFGRLIVDVWRDDVPRQALLLVGGPHPNLHPNAASEIVTPWRVADAIRTAIAAGWPSNQQAGSTLRLALPEVPRVQEDGTRE